MGICLPHTRLTAKGLPEKLIEFDPRETRKEITSGSVNVAERVNRGVEWGDLWIR